MKHPELEIAELVADELPGNRRAAVERHLAACARCSMIRDDLVRAMSALARAEPTLPVPPLLSRAPKVHAFGFVQIASVVGVLVLGIALGSIVPEAPDALAPVGATASGSASSVPTSTSGAPSPQPSSPVGCSLSRDGATYAMLQACPGGGAVGTVVTLEGRGCSYPGNEATIVFGPGYDENSAATGTFGGTQLPPIKVDANGAFSVQFLIPAELEPHQGVGGGPIRPGRYQFASKPAFCVVPFTVVSP